MKRFLKSLSLLLCSGLFAATGWAAGESISIKFNNGSFNNDTDYGCYPVKGSEWQIACNGDSGRSDGVKDGTITLKDGVSVHYSTSAHWTVATAGINTLLDAYLDDGAVDGHGTTITVSGLDTTTYANYDVLIYMTADTTPAQSKHFKAPTVNGTQYTLGGQGTDNWGSVHSRGRPRIGINCLPVYGLQATESNNELTISVPSLTQNDRTNGRASISAIQILPAGKIQPYEPSIFDSAISEWTFESSEGDLRGKVRDWDWDHVDTGVYVDSLRKDAAGIAYKAAKITSVFHPGAAYDWGGDDATYTIAAYVNLEKCSTNGAVLSVGGNALLRKKDAKTIQFGDKDNASCSVEAEMPHLSSGYHLIVAKRSPNSLSLKIDDGEMITVGNTFTLSNGLQMGVRWGGGNQSYNEGNGPIIDDVVIWKKDLTDVSQLVACYPVKYPTLSMAADTDVSGALSWSEITAVVGGSIVWNVSGKVTISLDADVSPALTALTLIPANDSGDSLKIEGTGSLWAENANFALTTTIPVTIKNVKFNPRMQLAGSGAVTFTKADGANDYGISLINNGYTGKLTVDGGQQITNNGELSIPFTVGEGGAKLHANGGRWHVSSTISGSGPLVVVGPSGSGDDDRIVVFSSNATDHDGPITVTEGRVRLGSNTDWNGRGEDTAFGDQTTITVNEGAMCRLHYGDNSTSANFVFEGNTTFGNVDGHAILNGTITVNGSSEKPVAFPFRWDKTITVNGKLSGEGTLTLTNPSNGGWGGWKLTNTANDFSGTIKLDGNRTRLTLTEDGTFATGHVEFGAAGELVLNADNTIAGLTGTAGTVKSDSETVRTLTLNGNSDVHNLTFTNVNLVIASGETFVNANTVATANNGTIVKVVLTADEMLNGAEANTAPAQNAEVTYVFLDADGTTVLKRGNSNVYEPAMNTWTSNVNNNWDTEANWSTEVLPSETANVEIRISGDTELMLNSSVTVASLRVTGTGTLTISGGKLTASIIDAQTDISASETTLALAPMNIAEGKTVTYTFATNAEMPALTGVGTFIKKGAVKLTLGNTTACEPTIVITSGTLELNSGAAYNSVYHFIVREGATIDVANAHIHMPSTESEITLEGGAKLKLQNGNSSSNRHIGAKILISESSADNPAIIVGSWNGNKTNLTGGITGSGLLEIRSEHANSFTISGAIKDQEGAQLAVKVSTTAGVIFSGTNTYTGGTEIVAGATLAAANINALGTGVITNNGTLDLTPGEAVDGITKAIEGNGTIKVKLTSVYGNEVNFTNFTGTTYVTSGCLSIDKGCLGSTLHLAGGVNVQTTKTTDDATLNIVLDGDTQFHTNNNMPYTTSGSITGDGKLIKKGAATLTVREVTTNCDIPVNVGNLIVNAGRGNESSIGQLTGSRGLTIQSGTITLSKANGGYSGTITVAEGATLASGTGVTCPFGKGTIMNDGTVRLSGGQLPPMSGTGSLVVTGVTEGQELASIAGPLTITGWMTVVAGNAVRLWHHQDDFTTQTPSINGPSIVLGSGSTIVAGDGYAETATMTIPANATLSGAGTIGVRLTLANGAIIDATNGAVTATGAVMLPGSGSVTVKVANYGDVLKAANLDATKFSLAEGDGLLVATNAALVYTAKPTLPENTTGVSDETIAEIAQMAASAGITNVTIEGITISGEGDDAVKADVAGLELFEGIPMSIVPDTNGTGKAILNYVFGISDITVNGEGHIVVKASVDYIVDNSVALIDGEGEGETPAEAEKPTFANDVTVKLYNGETEIGEAEVEAAGSSEIEITSDETLLAIFENGTGTLDLTVKATNVQTPDAGEGDEEEVTPAE